LRGQIEAAGGPAFYGRFQERGTPSAYEILAVKKRALHFMSHGREVFAKSVMHPPIAARPFMAPTLSEFEGKIRTELQEAVNRVIHES
jgi:hypothetical protein